MADTRFDVVGVGNAIVDILVHVEEPFLDEHSLAKGTMSLVDSEQAETLYSAVGAGIEASGGSAANTVAGIASLGGSACFIGKVRNDQLGSIFTHDIRTVGVTFDSAPADDGPATARCLVLVTPDAQRTMSTFLGASVNFAPEDLDEDAIADAKVTYLEGYLWDPPAAKDAFRRAVRVAHDAGRDVALSLSDRFCVDRHRTEFRDLVEHHVDLLFANEDELMALYETDSFDAALQAVRGACQTAALTRSEKGSVILANGEVHVVDAEPVANVIDTTGAGDLYAAGFLHGFCQGREPFDCARLGGIAAAEVISHIGARPQTSLASLVAQRSDAS